MIQAHFFDQPSERPDALDQINAFRAGYRHGQTYGDVSPREADTALRALPTPIPVTGATLACFCSGATDGSRQDSCRYILTFGVAP